MKSSVAPIRVHKKSTGKIEPDLLAVEEPLQIQIGIKGDWHDLAVTMRTPGNDFELVTGFLFTEGIIEKYDDINSIRYCEHVPDEARGNVVKIALGSGLEFSPEELKRNFYATSSCGVCGKSSIDQIRVSCGSIPELPPFPVAVIEQSLEAMRGRQDVFRHTGGLHACATVDRSGDVQLVREDIGRHNALDKLIGSSLIGNHVPLHDHVLLLSGRASFEMVQKAARAGFPVIAAIGAPSNLAVRLAEEQQMALLGFVRDDNFNIYSGKDRIAL